VALLKAAGAQPLPEPKATVERAVLERYVGDYAGEGVRALRFSVALGEAGLSLRLGADPVPLGAYDERTFQTLKPPRARLTFEAQGEPMRATVKLGDRETVVTRVSGRQP